MYAREPLYKFLVASSSIQSNTLYTTWYPVFLFRVGHIYWYCYCERTVLFWFVFSPFSLYPLAVSLSLWCFFQTEIPFRRECLAVRVSSARNKMLYMVFSIPFHALLILFSNVIRRKTVQTNSKKSIQPEKRKRKKYTYEQANAIRLKNDVSDLYRNETTFYLFISVFFFSLQMY